ncbi:MAG: AMP-binding protein [Alphaproteobacteria bacterium]
MGPLSISRLIALQAARDPHRPAITHDDVTVTRGELEARTNRLARAFANFGVRQGRMVTIGLPNGLAFYEAALAAWKLGAIPQPVSARLPAAEFAAIVDLADPALVVGGPEGVATGRPRIGGDYVPPQTIGTDPLPDAISPNWKAPTSGGSTGRPKLIVAGEPGAFDPQADFLGMAPDMVHLVPGPLYHNAPFTFSARGLFMGHHLVVMSRFDAERTLALIDRYKVNWLMLVPTMMQRIWRLEPEIRDRYDLSSVQVLWHLAAPCPPWLKEAWIDWLGAERIWELYAGTEAQGRTVISGAEWLAHKGSVGRPVGCRIEICDPEGRVLPAGEVGEIFMIPDTGQGSTYHYVGAEPRARDDGFESLGDMGSLDADGYLYLADRRTDMILSGGANIYPAEVEAVIDSHPAVRSSCVIGLPDDDLGQRVHAIVDAPDPVSAEELLAFLADKLVRYKIPRTVEFVSTPVRDDAGKVRRSALRAERL